MTIRLMNPDISTDRRLIVIMRFVLVHGGFHGTWCWSKLIPELERLGHTTLAIDLPGCNERRDEKASLSSWRSSLREVIDDGDILVGHSMGGFAISLGADAEPDKVSRLIYLSGSVPLNGATIGESTSHSAIAEWTERVGMPHEEFMGIIDLPEQGPCLRITSQKAANTLFYHDCTQEDQDWAWERLTPLPLGLSQETFHLPRFLKAPIPRDFIITTDDRSHPISLSNLFMDRLGISTAFSIRSSHSPFISYPAATARLLDACSRGCIS